MPSSYREPDRRDGDQIVYFDYAKSLESRRRPLPWADIARSAAYMGVIGFCEALFFSGRPSAIGGLLLGGPMTFIALGLIPLIRTNRGLSGDNFVTVQRGRKPTTNAVESRREPAK